MYVCILLQLTSAQLSSAQPSPAQPSQASNPQLQPTPASSCSVSLAYRASSVCVCVGKPWGLFGVSSFSPPATSFYTSAIVDGAAAVSLGQLETGNWKLETVKAGKQGIGDQQSTYSGQVRCMHTAPSLELYISTSLHLYISTYLLRSNSKNWSPLLYSTVIKQMILLL